MPAVFPARQWFPCLSEESLALNNKMIIFKDYREIASLTFDIIERRDSFCLESGRKQPPELFIGKFEISLLSSSGFCGAISSLILDMIERCDPFCLDSENTAPLPSLYGKFEYFFLRSNDCYRAIGKPYYQYNNTSCFFLPRYRELATIPITGKFEHLLIFT